MIRGHHRDKMKSSKERAISSSGLRWVVMMVVVMVVVMVVMMMVMMMVMMVVVQVPWSGRPWALPFFCVLAAQLTTPKVSKKLGKPHKTIGEIAQQMIIVVRRWFPDATQAPMKLIGDSAYSIVELGLCCARHNGTLVISCAFAPGFSSV